MIFLTKIGKAKAVFRSALRAPEKLVALALLDDTVQSVERLVGSTSLGRRTVLRSLQVLESTGTILVSRQNGRSSVYQLGPMTDLPGPQRHRRLPGTATAAAESLLPAPQRHRTGATAAPLPVSQSHRSQTGTGSGASDPDLDLDLRSNKNPHHPKDLEANARTSAGLGDEDFSSLSLADRAEMIGRDPKLALVLLPHLWPEVVELCAAFAKATGRERKVANYGQDSGVRALVALLTAFPLARLLEVLPQAVTSPWWREKPERPLSHLSIEVIEIAGGLQAAHDIEVTRAIELARPRPPRKTYPAPLAAGMVVGGE